MSFLPPGLMDFYKRYDKAITAPDTPVTPPAPDITRSGPTPSDTRTNGLGVQQTGRNLGSLSLADATTYLQESTKGYVQGFGDNTFGGSQLPSTPGNPYSATPSVTPGFDMSVPDIGGMNAVNFDRDGGVAAAGTRDLTGNTPITGEEQRIEGASDRPAGGRMNDALNDKAGINSYMDKFSSNDKELARRSAFLDAPDTLSGMKAVKAQQNMMSLGTKDYLVTGDELTAIDSGDMRDRLAGRMSAEDLKSKYVKDITDSSAATPDQAQAPAVLEQDTPSTQRNERNTVPLDEVNKYLNNGQSDKYFEMLDSGQLTRR